LNEFSDGASATKLGRVFQVLVMPLVKLATDAEECFVC